MRTYLKHDNQENTGNNEMQTEKKYIFYILSIQELYRKQAEIEIQNKKIKKSCMYYNYILYDYIYSNFRWSSLNISVPSKKMQVLNNMH